MKNSIVLLLLASYTVCAQTAEPKKYKPSVLVEFFTSEGCSSCAETDAFAQEIRAISDSNDLMVYTLDWHVDLWDKSGWKDPFSDSTYSMRQQSMAVKNKQNAIFTPMAFVNGKGALPAGAKKDIGAMIERVATQPSNHFLLFSASWSPTEKQLTLEYEIKGKPDSLDVVFVLVEKEIHNFVSAGENKGKTLHHHNVARKVEVNQRQTAFGTSFLKFATTEVDFSRYRIIAFLQHKRTFEIMACQMLNFKQ